MRPNPRQVTPSTSLVKAMASKHARSSICAGTGCCNKIPCTSGLALSFSISANNCSVVVSLPSSTFNESMPTRRQALPFMRTYVADAPSSPTKIVARIGVRPVFAFNASTRANKSVSIFFANARPSKTNATAHLQSRSESILQIIHDYLGIFILSAEFMCIYTVSSIVFFSKIANMCITKRWRGGRVVMQRTATPCTPVRFRPPPPILCNARVVK